MLTSMQAVEGAMVVDLFAGSGALGIEALSRGAKSVVFVDCDSAAIRAIRGNLSGLGDLADRATVVRGDAEDFALGAGFADLVLADPPYSYRGWPALLGCLAGRVGVLVAETGSHWDPGSGWETVKVRKYGGTVVTVVRPIASHPVANHPVVSNTALAPQEGET